MKLLERFCDKCEQAQKKKKMNTVRERDMQLIYWGRGVPGDMPSHPHKMHKKRFHPTPHTHPFVYAGITITPPVLQVHIRPHHIRQVLLLHHLHLHPHHHLRMDWPIFHECFGRTPFFLRSRRQVGTV